MPQNTPSEVTVGYNTTNLNANEKDWNPTEDNGEKRKLIINRVKVC